MVITHNFTIALNRRGVTPMVDAVQGDSLTRKLAVTLIEDGGTGWPVPSGVTAAVAFRKPDGHKGLYDKLPDGGNAVTISNNTVTAVLAPEVLSCAGEVLAAIVLHDKNLKQLATFPVCIRVAANPAAGQAVSNDYYSYSTMEEVSDAVEASLEQLEADKQAFLEAAAEALLVVHDAATEGAPAIVCEKTGSVISANDASDRPLKGLVLYGKTTQDGTPTPENPVELVTVGAGGAINTTVAGKNLFDNTLPLTKSTGAAKTETETGFRIVSKYDGGPYYGYIQLLPYDVIAGKTFHFSMKVSSSTTNTSRPEIGVCDFGCENRTMLFKPTAANNYTISGTFPEEYLGQNKYLYMWVSATTSKDSAAGDYFQYDDVMLCVGESAPYQPYTAQTLTAATPNGLPGIPVSGGGNHTDENGQQWICDEVDFARGVYVQRVATSAYIGTETWHVQEGSSYIQVYASAKNGAKKTGVDNLLSTHYPINGNLGNGTVFGAPDYSWIYFRFTKESGFFTSVDTATNEWKAFLADKASMGNPVTVLYELATPIETPLTAEALAAYAALHTNKPNTTVYNDAGAGMKLQYVADTKIYIDNKFAELANAIVNNA